jgi:hypothetical protein
MSAKKGAMELSISTIVIIVLAMSMLIFGLILIRNIFAGGTNAIDTINDQVTNEINKMFGEDKKVVIYPTVNPIVIRQGKPSGFAIGIKNKNKGLAAQTAEFSYTVIPVSASSVERDCGITVEQIMDLFVAGSNEDSGIPIPTSSDTKAIPILFDTGEGSPICTVRFRVDVKESERNYDTAYVYVKFRD